MTYEEFLEALRKTPRTWGFLNKKYIRQRETDDDGGIYWKDCPISSLGRGEDMCAGRWVKAANQLELPMDIAASIVAAADSNSGYDPIVREDLLRACGLPSGVTVVVHDASELYEQVKEKILEEIKA